jgi:putative endopeptidase
MLTTKFKFFLLITVFLGGISSTSFSKTKERGDEINKKDMDTTISPAVDFFEYANGTWLKNTEIPAAFSGWGSFYILRDDNLSRIQSILSDVEKKADLKKGSSEQFVGDFYYTGMDSANIEKQGYKPIGDDLDAVNSIKDLNDFYKELVNIHLGYSNPLFAFGSGPDAKNSKINIAQLEQSGLGLPDRDYYLKDDDNTKTIRESYVNLIKESFMLIGYDSVKAANNASLILALETQLAKVSMSRVDQRDPQKV